MVANAFTMLLVESGLQKYPESKEKWNNNGGGNSRMQGKRKKGKYNS